MDTPTKPVKDIIDTAISKGLQTAINAEGERVPEGTIPHFHGSPALAWENPPPDVRNAKYNDRVHGERTVFEILTSPSNPSSIAAAYSVAPAPTVPEIINGLLAPGFDKPIPGVNNGGMATIDMGYVMKVMGNAISEHLEWSTEMNRPMLKRDSELMSNGRGMGMPELYMQWLGGANSDATLRIPLNTLKTAHNSRNVAKK